MLTEWHILRIIISEVHCIELSDTENSVKLKALRWVANTHRVIESHNDEYGLDETNAWGLCCAEIIVVVVVAEMYEYETLML